MRARERAPQARRVVGVGSDDLGPRLRERLRRSPGLPRERAHRGIAARVGQDRSREPAPLRARGAEDGEDRIYGGIAGLRCSDCTWERSLRTALRRIDRRSHRPRRRRAMLRRSQGQCGGSGTRPPPGRGCDAELVEDVRDVALDGVRAQVERACDELVAVAGRDPAQHVELARRQVPQGSLPGTAPGTRGESISDQARSVAHSRRRDGVLPVDVASSASALPANSAPPGTPSATARSNTGASTCGRSS